MPLPGQICLQLGGQWEKKRKFEKGVNENLFHEIQLPIHPAQALLDRRSGRKLTAFRYTEPLETLMPNVVENRIQRMTRAQQ